MTTYDFELDPRLDNDSLFLTDWPLCRVLRMNDRAYPWLILVPEREGIREIHELEPQDRGTLIEEIARAGESLERLFAPDKINVGALGNIVPQLHVHVIARSTGDSAWPGPVWGSGAAVPYRESELEAIQEQLARSAR